MLGHVKFDHCVPGEVIGPVQLQPLVMPQKEVIRKAAWQASCSLGNLGAASIKSTKAAMSSKIARILELPVVHLFYQCFAFPSFCPKERLGLMRLVGAGEHG